MGRLSKDEIVKGVIVAAIGTPIAAGVIALATYLGLTPPAFVASLKSAYEFLIAGVTLPRWGFWLWAIASAVVVALVAVKIRAAFSPLGYRTDVIFCLRWRWDLSTDGTVLSPTMFCPKCDHQCKSADFSYGDPAQKVWLVNCVNCGHEAKVPMVADLADRAKSEVQRRLRTDEWKRAR